MSSFVKIFSQTFWQILGKAITTFSTFIILGLVARNYGKAGTGVFTLALTYLAIFYLLVDFGFNAHVLKKFTIYNLQFTIEWKKLLGTRLVWSGVLMVTAVGLLLFWPFSTPQFSQAVIFGSLAIGASAVFTTCNLIFQSKLRYDLSVLASSLGTLFSLLAFILLSFYKYQIPFLLFAHLIGWVLIALVALILVRKLLQNITPVFDKQYTINLLKESWPVAATLGLNVIYFRADSFILAYYKNISDVGVYNTAYSIFQSALVLPTFIMNAYYPLMLKSLGSVKYVALGFVVLALFGTGITLILAPAVIAILTGGGFSQSVVSLQILSLGFPAFFLSSLLMWVLISKGQYKRMFVLYTSATIINLLLNFIFIPKFSYIAASWITVVSEYLILVMQVMVLWFGKIRQQMIEGSR